MIRWLLAFVLVALASAPAEALDRRAFAREFGAIADAMATQPNGPPGVTVMVTQGNRVIFERAWGMADIDARTPMSLDTVLVTASITKSHVALLAARMDAEGVLSLDATLADVWPNLTLPAPLDPRAITVRRLLSHTSGMQDQWLDLRSIVAGNIGLADVPGHLSRYATTTEPGFQYSNLGPYLYSMMLEQVTGRDWRELLEEKVLRPMGLRHSTIRMTDLNESAFGYCNARTQAGWGRIEQVDPASLNAAGGLHASTRDLSRFVRAFTSRRGVRGLPAPMLARTWREETPQAGDLIGFERYAYGLGWDISRYEGDVFISRSGGYPGCRSIVMFQPSTGISVAGLAAGDAGGNVILYTLAKRAFDVAAGRATPERNAAWLEEFTTAFNASIARADAIMLPDLTRPVDAARLRDYAGTYVSDQLGEIVFTTAPNGLAGRWGVFEMILLPGEGDAFTGHSLEDAEAMAFRFERDAAGRVSGVRWDDLLLARVR